MKQKNWCLITCSFLLLFVSTICGQGYIEIGAGKSVTASSTESGYPPSNVNDGSNTTRWASAVGDPQWVMIDLGSTNAITRVVLNWETASAKNYEIQVSSASTGPWTPIVTKTDMPAGPRVDNLTGLSGSGRFIRMYGAVRNTQWGYSLFSFEVYRSGTGSTNLINNGDFSQGSTGWQLACYNGAVAQSNFNNQQYLIAISNGGTQNWNVQVTQTGISLVQGKQYKFSFDASAEAARSIDAIIEKNGTPYTNYGNIPTWNITTTNQHFTYTFTMPENDPAARVTLNLGNSNSDITIDNIELTEVTVQQVLTKIDVTPMESYIGVGGTVLFNARGYDQLGTQMTINPVWSVVNGGGTITSGGQFTATTVGGPYYVTAVSNGITGVALVTVTAGSQEIAQGKPASASTTESPYYPSNANDGNSSTRWSSNFSDPQWIMIDLQNTYTIQSVLLNWETASARVYAIEISSSSSGPWAPIASKTNMASGSRIDNLTGLSGSGRYIRMYGTQRNTQYGYSLFDFKVYGILGSQAPIVDMSVDTDRDGVIEADDNYLEDNYSSGRGSRGAIVLANCDDDNNDKLPDNWQGGNWSNKGFIATDNVVNSSSDIADIGQLCVKKMGTLSSNQSVTIDVSNPAIENAFFQTTPAINRIRIFLPSKQNGNDLEIQANDRSIVGPEYSYSHVIFCSNPVGGYNQFSSAVFNGNGVVKFGIEGIEMGAMVNITINLYDGRILLGSDVVRVRVSPFVLSDHTMPVNTGMASKTIFRDIYNPAYDELSQALIGIFGEGRIDFTGGDSWMQDVWEIGYTKAAYPIGGMPIILTLARGFHRKSESNFYACNNLIAPNVGVYTRIENYPLISSGTLHTQDYGGDLESFPVDGGSKPGKFMHGPALNLDMLSFFNAQGVNENQTLNVAFQGVQHVDEKVSPAPGNNKSVVMDPEICLALLLMAKDIQFDVTMNYPPEPVASVVNDPIRNANVTEFMKPVNLPSIFNNLGLQFPESAVQGGCLSKWRALIGFFDQPLKKRYYRVNYSDRGYYRIEYRDEGENAWRVDPKVGTTVADVVFHEAKCFIRKEWWSSTPPVNSTIITFNADPANCSAYGLPDGVFKTESYVNCFVSGNNVVANKGCGPNVPLYSYGMVDILDKYSERIFSLVGYTNIKFPKVSVADGSVHCMTNQIRVVPTYNWWNF